MSESTAPDRDAVASALVALRAAAQAGDAGAQALYAQALAEGRGVARDAVEALHWYALAANGGHAEAMNMLGRCHELGIGTAADAQLAAAWYRRAAATGSPWGMYNLAQLLGAGRGVAQDRARALAWYRRAAERGHAKSMNMLGRHYDEGWAVERDAAAAADWYRRAAHAGDFRGQVSHASLLMQRGDADEAVLWLRRAAETATPAFLERLSTDLQRSPHAAMRAEAAALREAAARNARRESLA